MCTRERGGLSLLELERVVGVEDVGGVESVSVFVFAVSPSGAYGDHLGRVRVWLELSGWLLSGLWLVTSVVKVEATVLAGMVVGRGSAVAV